MEKAPVLERIPSSGPTPVIRAGAAALGVSADLVDLPALRRGEAQLLAERARLRPDRPGGTTGASKGASLTAF